MIPIRFIALEYYLLLLWRIAEPASRMEDAKIVDKLDIALPEIKANGILLRGVMKRVQSLGLRFGDGRDVGGSGEAPVSGEGPARILND